MRQDELKMISTCFFDRCCHVILYTLTALYGHVKGTSQTTCGFSYHHICLCIPYIIQEKHKILCLTHFSVQHWTCDLVFLHSSAYLYHYRTADSRDVINLATFFCDTCTLQKHLCNKCVFQTQWPPLYEKEYTSGVEVQFALYLKWCNMWSSHLALQSWHFPMLSTAVKDVFCIWEDGRHFTKQSHECRLPVCSQFCTLLYKYLN